ncbi:sporulation membrane protein YtaF [Halalkalibacillus halophilus]|uniref:sporulation membrane protein YtaF n=1 Tax=Halalkalibacillus halophilus TaxID=392827 RepID=UPI00041A3B94|nr:sporulation membrane protein YtaF [Halalkalibacillus halophilus]
MFDLLFVILIISIAVSFDSFFFGLTYRLRSIKLSKPTYLVIGLFTSCSFLLGGVLGSAAKYVLPFLSNILGGLILIAIGMWALYQWIQEQRVKVRHYKNVEENLLSIRKIWEILKKPQVADHDYSGSIKGMEAIVVAIALSIDSFATGIGAAFLPVPVIICAMVIGMTSLVCLHLGWLAGGVVNKCNWLQPFACLPGIILISLGIWNFIR